MAESAAIEINTPSFMRDIYQFFFENDYKTASIIWINKTHARALAVLTI